MRFGIRPATLLTRLLLGAGLAGVLLFAVEEICLRFRIPPGREPVGAVQVHRFYAVRLKNGKTVFYDLAPETQPCARSALPHLGLLPCWYLDRQREQEIKV